MAGEDIHSWSVTATDNGSSDASITWIEHQARASVNNSARSMMAAHAKERNLLNGSIVTTGTANAQAVLSGRTYTTIPTGLRAKFKVGPGLTNTGATTLNMDGLGDTLVKTTAGADLRGGEFVAGEYVDLLYNGTNWLLLGSVLHSPILTGDPQAPNPPLGDHDNSIATTRWVQDELMGGQGIILAQQVFPTAGSFVYTPHALMKCAIVECVGGGGAGGGAYSAQPVEIMVGAGGGG